MVDHCSKEATRLFQSAWEIEEHGPNGAFQFYHRPFIEALHIADA